MPAANALRIRSIEIDPDRFQVLDRAEKVVVEHYGT
jgi:hypothetical protein